jgi:proton-dependent oligopeptide transporter, POT family
MSSTAAIPTTNPAKERHPRELYVLFATELWERYGFYTAAAIMTLYLQRGGFGWTKDGATNLWSYYLMFVYLTPLLGGWLADKYIGYRRSVLIGGAFFVAGYTMLGFGSPPLFYAALALLFVGNGFFKPNISTMVGNLYPAGSPLKDSAYSIFYMGINVGAFLAPIVAEILLQTFAGSEIIAAAKAGEPLTPENAAMLRNGFLASFFAAAGGMTLGTVIFAGFYRSLAGAERKGDAKPMLDPAVDAVTEDVPPSASEKAASAIDNVPEMTRIAALLVIFGIVIVFWMVFHQNGSTMTYWADENTDWKVSGVVSNSINPFWIVVLTVPLVWFWGWLRSKGLEPSSPTKMALGMLLTSLAFLVLYAGAKSGGDQTFMTVAQAEAKRATIAEEAAKAPEKKIVVPKVIPVSDGKYAVNQKGEYWAIQNKVSPFWLIFAYMVISLGELMLSPMGLSLVSKVAPARMRGLMMGGWFVATAIGNKLTAIGLLWTRWYHSSFWLLCSLSALGMALLLVLLLRPLKKAMPGV